MKRVAILALAIACACGELRAANRSADDAGAPPPDDADVKTKPKDAAASDDDDEIESGGPEAGPDASPEAIASSKSVTAISVDSKNVYYADSTGIYQCPSSGCGDTPSKLADGSPTRLAIAGGKVFWADPDGQRIASCLIGGCPSPETAIANEAAPDDVVTNGSTLAYEGDGTVRRVAVSGGSAETVAPTEVSRRSIAIGGSRIVWCALDAMVRSCPILGTCPVPVVLGACDSSIAISGSNAFWGTTFAIVSCPLDQKCYAPKTLTAAAHVSSVVADDAEVYWRDKDARTILRCPLAGCEAPEVVATGIEAPTTMALALDARYVYWNTATGIVRLKKR